MTRFMCVLGVFCVLTTVSCSDNEKARTAPEDSVRAAGFERAPEPLLPDSTMSGAETSLIELAELERSGGFQQGFGLLESELRENAGDYAGAVIAAYKELAWAYSYGTVSQEAITSGLERVKNLFQERTYAEGVNRDAVIAEIDGAVDGAIAFMNGDWERAERALERFFADDYEPDSFARWMLLSCRLENGISGANLRGADKAARSAYSGIRSRYVNLPEYWYRGARAEEAFSETIACGYAERCVNLAPSGPYAAACRELLARSSGLPESDGAAMRTRAEIERAAARAAEENAPELLVELFPALALPDNAYTLYAAGIMRRLAGTSVFKEYFAAQRDTAAGRLKERLAYIAQ